MDRDSENDDISRPICPQSAADWENYYDLRWRILREPWEQPRGSEKDDREAESEHVMIVGPERQVLAVGRLHFNSPAEAQVRFMAVVPEVRGRGLGGVVLRELERRARVAGATSIVLNARDGARLFYQNHGFVVTGPAPTMFDAVEHVRMRKEL